MSNMYEEARGESEAGISIMMEVEADKKKDKEAERSWIKMVSASKDAIEDFNDFASDHGVVWADNRIHKLEKELEKVSEK